MRVNINHQNGKFENTAIGDFIYGLFLRPFMWFIFILDIKDVSFDSGRVARAACESRAKQ